jgi:hypothetical protein
MDGTVPTLHSTSSLLSDVLALMGKVSSERDSWCASPAELRFLAEVSAATGQCLPAEAIDSASVTLCFLVNARFRLESKVVPTRRKLTRSAVSASAHR